MNCVLLCVAEKLEKLVFIIFTITGLFSWSYFMNECDSGCRYFTVGVERTSFKRKISYSILHVDRL